MNFTDNTYLLINYYFHMEIGNIYFAVIEDIDRNAYEEINRTFFLTQIEIKSKVKETIVDTKRKIYGGEIPTNYMCPNFD